MEQTKDGRRRTLAYLEKSSTKKPGAATNLDMAFRKRLMSIGLDGGPDGTSLIKKKTVIWFPFLLFLQILPSFTGVTRVLVDFNGFYRIVLSFTGFHWVLPSFTGFYWVLLGSTGSYWVLLDFTGFYWALLGLTGSY